MSGATITFPILGEDFAICPPNSFTVFGREIYWYAVIIAFGLVLGVTYMFRQRKHFGIEEDNLIDVLLWVVPVGIVGARLYYVVFNFQLYKDDLMDIFKIWEGGIAIYGSVIAGALAAIIYSKRKKLSTGAVLDLVSMAVIIGQAVGRWGNFINREAYGTSANVSEFFLRMGLTLNGKTIYVHPTFLYESVWNLIGFAIIHFVVKKRRKYDGQVFNFYAAWYGLGRFFIEGLRTDSLYLFGELRVSQLVGLVSFVVAAGYMIYMLKVKKCDGTNLYVNRPVAVEGEPSAQEIESNETEHESEKEECTEQEENKNGSI